MNPNPENSADCAAQSATTEPTYGLRVHVPVTLSILVPVDVTVPGEKPSDLPVDEGCGVPILDLEGRDDAEAIATAALRAALDSQQIVDATEALRLALQFYRRGEPGAVAKFSPFFGLVPEEDL